MINFSLLTRLKAIYPYLLIIFFALGLIIIWFWNGQILASSESALPFTNLGRYVELTSNAWSNYALGNYPGFTSASWLTYVALWELHNLGLPGFLIEAIFLYLIFVVSGVSIYELGRELFPETKQSFLLLGVVYYWFSPFALVNIWNRFLYNYMVFAALFPLVVWLFIKGLRLKKYIFCFYIGLVSVIFSYASTSPPFDFLLWAVLGGIFFLNVLWTKSKKDKIFALQFFILSLIFYILFNLWWISQMFSYSAAERSSPSTNLFFNSIDNLDTIQNISGRLGNLTDVVRLMHHDFYQNITVGWVQFYNRFPSLVFEFGSLIITFFVMFVKLKKRAVLLCGFFILLGLFLMKGSAPPFGGLTLWLFSQSSVLQLFRNPFEKFGFLVPVFLAPMLAYSFYWMFGRWPFLKIMGIILLIIFTFFYGRPFLTKQLFSYQDNAGVWRSYSVSVPDYYKQANEWLKTQGDNFRIVAFPLGGEGITYNWNYPFSGVESTNTLLNIAAISYNTTIPYYSDISNKLEEDFLYDPHFFVKAKLLNIRYILLRTDIKFQDRQMMNPQVIRGRINFYQSKGLLKPVKQFGELGFWEISDWQDTAITTNVVIDTATPIQSFKLIDQQSTQSALVDPAVTTFLPSSSLNQTWLFPQDQLSIDSIITLGYERDQKIFPFVAHLPGEVEYPLVRLKEDLQLMMIFNQKEKMKAQLFLLGKRISEMEVARNKKKWNAFDQSLANYQIDFEIFMKEIDRYAENPDSQYQIWKSQYLYTIFIRNQNYFLALLINPYLDQEQKKRISSLKQQVESGLKRNYIIPLKTKQVISQDAMDIWKFYKFSNVKKGAYHFVSANKVNFIPGQKFEYSFKINGVLYHQMVTVRDDKRFDLGQINLESGDNEIALSPLDTGQLIDLSTQVVNQEESIVTLPDYDPSTLFYLSFSYLLPDGGQLIISQYGDNDVSRNGQAIASHQVSLAWSLDHQKHLNHQIFHPGDNTDQTQLGFQLKNPSCQQISPEVADCLKTTLENLSVKKYVQIEPVLVTQNIQTVLSDQLKINYSKISDSKYSLTMVNDGGPFILNLNQLYHPGWQLNLNGQNVTDHILVNSYANGWVISQTGSLQAKIEFRPDFYYKSSQIISLISIIAVSGFFGFRSLKDRYGKN